MNASKKRTNYNRFGLTGSQKKTGINYWRYFFTGTNKISGTEKTFCLEFEILNPSVSSDEPVLGFKPRVKITSEDLQYALAGTSSAANLETENIVKPTYAVVRMSILGDASKQICKYVSNKETQINTKTFEIHVGNIVFNDEALSGFIDVPQEEKDAHPEYLCDTGYCSWNLTYNIVKDFYQGYKDKEKFWFPLGLSAMFTGNVNFDGNDYVINPKKCAGFIERYHGKIFPEIWFHLSSASLTSIITGQYLFNSSFVAKGIFDERISFVANFEDTEVVFKADSSKRDYSVVWDCTQMPSNDEDDDELLHWSISINSKVWIIDIDVYCKVKDLYNKKVEIPEGNRKFLSILQGGTGYGEIKLFKCIKNTLEQIEYAKLSNVVCEFGQIDSGLE